MPKFIVGDRVICTAVHDSASPGMVGTVALLRSPNGIFHSHGAVGVAYDNKFDGGHDLDGNCRYGYGHNMDAHKLRRIDPNGGE